MARNTLLNRIFNTSASRADEFDLTRRSRTRRLHEIFVILRQHKVTQGMTPEGFRAVLEDLGPSFVKIGQTLSTRSEILPEAYCRELKKLQTECDPLSFDEILAALDDIYGDEQGELFDAIDPHPLGSASLAQVHKARLRNGDVVAVKFQRPGVRETMAQDLDIMRSAARHASKFIKEDQMIDLQAVVEELWDTFLEETNFQKEADNLKEFARLNKDVTFIDCPRVYEELSGENVVVMEYIDGIPIGDRKALVKAGYNLEEIGEKLLDNYATQVLDHGFFHADPHPGNVIIREGRIVYVDLGNMGRLSPRDRSAFGDIITAVGLQSSVKLKDALLAFAVTKDNDAIDHPRFLADLDLLLEEYGSCDVADIDIGQFLTDVLSLTRVCKVTLPSAVTSISRGIVTIEGTIGPYIPNSNIVAIINDHIQNTTNKYDLLVSRLEDLALQVRASTAGALDAAEYSGEALRMLTRGQLKVNMNMGASNAFGRRIGEVANRLTIGIVIAGLFIGSSMLSLSSMEPRLLGVPVLGACGFFGAAILSVWLLWDIRRRN